ncbi:hypothetical protein CSC17_3290 [Klebsiella oxytoca]|nr:hypothetical protein CSC17_3290 [Klebsiella oxytoca]
MEPPCERWRPLCTGKALLLMLQEAETTNSEYINTQDR